MQPLELRLDTLSCFQLAIFGLDLLRDSVVSRFNQGAFFQPQDRSHIYCRSVMNGLMVLLIALAY